MGNACSAASRADAIAPNDRPAAVKQAPKRYTSRKSVVFLDGAPNPNSLPPKHDQRRRLTEEQEASERCVAALRDGEAKVFGVRDASQPVPLQCVPTQPCLTREYESECAALANNGSCSRRANDPSQTPLPMPAFHGIPTHQNEEIPKDLSTGVICGGQESSASSGAKKRESISSWTVSQNQLGGGNGEGESFDFTASWGSCAPVSRSSLGDANAAELDDLEQPTLGSRRC